MPELPEVETIRKGLEHHIVGRRIERVEVRLAKMVSGDVEEITGGTVIGVRRYGKGLVIDLDTKITIAIHVKMTGQLIFRDNTTLLTPHPVKVGKLPGQHTHVIIYFDQDAVLYYNDIRQFGWMKILPTDQIENLDFFKTLGPEPLKNLSLDMFGTILAGSKGPIKPLLMEQKKIAGIGNIYANDALFIAKIHPTRPANSLSMDEVRKVFEGVETVLKKGLEVGGASEWQYVNAEGQTGEYQNFFQVYGREGKPCYVCSGVIEKITMGGRGTFFCPYCQV